MNVASKDHLRSPDYPLGPVRMVAGALRCLLFLWLSAICGMFVVPPASAESIAEDDETSGSDLGTRPLSELIREYLTTQDGHRAGRLLTAILGRPETRLDEIQAILRTGRTYKTQPVGVQPSLSIRVQDHLYRYGLFVPPSYNPKNEYALVMCLHGAGFTGDSYVERWQKRLGERYILACPTLVQGTWWTRRAEELVLATIRAVRRRYHVNPERIFLTGMSNGGIGAWLIGCHNATLFAGLAPMASGIDDVLFPFLENLRHTPVYIIHGRKDRVMPVELTRSIVKVLSGLGYAFVVREHDRSHPMAGGHFFPREELPDLVKWLDTQRRDPLPKRITLVRDASHLTTSGWVRIDATDRIAAFTENLIDSRDEYLVNRIYARIEAEVVGPNRIEVRTTRVRRYTLFLNRGLVDLRKPITVVTNGRVTHTGHVDANPKTLLRQARLRRDRNGLFPAKLTLSVERER